MEQIRSDIVSTVRLVPQLGRHNFHHPIWDSNPVSLPALDARVAAHAWVPTLQAAIIAAATVALAIGSAAAVATATAVLP